MKKKAIITVSIILVTLFIVTIFKYQEGQSKVDADGGVSLTVPHPKLIEMENLLIKKCEEAGIYIKITEDVRNIRTQDKYYDKGASMVRGKDYDGLHQWGVAFDVCINVVGHEYDEDLLDKVGEIGKAIGLEWGGDWKKFVDKPHFQLNEMIIVNGEMVNKYSREYLKSNYATPKEFADSW